MFKNFDAQTGPPEIWIFRSRADVAGPCLCGISLRLISNFAQISLQDSGNA